VENKMKIVLAIFVFFVSLSARAEIYILYINGALNSSPSVRAAAQNKFKEIMIENGLIDKTEPNGEITRGLFRSSSYIRYDNGPFSSNPLLVAYQQGLSAEAFDKSGLNPNSKSLDYYYSTLGKIYNEQMSMLDRVPLMQRAALFFSYGYAADIKKILIEGNQLVIVSHSQGNLYTEAAIALLANDIEVSQKIKSSLRVIGLGSVSATTKDGRYITISQDKVVDGVGGKRDFKFKALPPNYEACLLYCWSIGSVATTEEIDKYTKGTNAHGAREIYLNSAINVWPIGEKDSSNQYSSDRLLARLIKDSWFEIKTNNFNKKVKSISFITTSSTSSYITEKNVVDFWD